MRRPVVATRVTGCVDAVVDGVTGTLVAAGDSRSLCAALRAYVADADLRERHGTAGRLRVLADFAPEGICVELADTYARMIESRRLARSFYLRCGKRALDVVLSACGLLAGSPLLAVTALALLITGRRVLFRQTRPGLRGRPFELLKFQTMSDARDAAGNLLPDADRLTAVGRFLRSTSIDELPELWNVLRGDMSLVGPRPLLVQYLDRYTPEQARRHDVRPGVTGLAQVSGRNALAWERRFVLDVEYVDTCSLSLDLKILARTAWAVIARRNISEPGHATAREFMGTQPR
jgi:lipopolysaccharide/colanic/teichoic acid biosynthesis glycosyltransferase